jgi:hypothetical protein
LEALSLGFSDFVVSSLELKDDLTVSLLQARLIELLLPINVAGGTQI